MDISVVIPVYKAEDCLNELYRQLVQAIERLTKDFEIILIEDCGGDRSWEIIRELALKDPRVKGVHLSRNFGQHFAITAGLEHASGEWVVVMDCDLQDDPVYIPELYRKANEGFHIVYAQKRARRHGMLKNILSCVFYRMLSYISEFNMDPNIGSYSIISRRTVDAFLNFNDYRRGYLMVLKWLGFSSTVIPVEHREREGKSSYTLGKLVQLAVSHSLVYSDKPLRLSIYTGLILACCAFAGACYWIMRYFTGYILPGWTTVVVLNALIGGLLMVFIGIASIYISKIFEQVKGRPLYVVQERIGDLRQK